MNLIYIKKEKRRNSLSVSSGLYVIPKLVTEVGIKK